MYLINGIYNLCEKKEYVFNVLLEYSIIILFYVGNMAIYVKEEHVCGVPGLFICMM